jgi:hypothetical protein
MCSPGGAGNSHLPEERPHLADTYAFLIRPILFFRYALHG